MIKKFVFATLGLIVVLVVLGGVYAMMIRQLIAAASTMQPPPLSVATAEVRQGEWESILTAVGSLVAVQGTIVSAETEGVVRKIPFKPGSVVESGAVLVELDTEVEASQLQSAEASLELARANLRRARELFDSKTISRAELDAAEAAMKQAAAQRDNVQAVMAKKILRAPFTGRLGIRLISPGEFLSKGDPVVSLQSFDPIYAEFSLPQQDLSSLHEGLTVRVETDAWPEDVFTGEITALNPQVDVTTRTLRLQATLPNPDGRLRAGMFCEVEVVLPEAQSVLIVPGTAVLSSTSGDTVFVVEPGSEEAGALVAKQRRVRTGDARGGFVSITSGVVEGEKVVMAGAFKLRDGAAVVLSDTGVPSPSLNPSPPDN